jgi:ankyrin repeat protein
VIAKLIVAIAAGATTIAGAVAVSTVPAQAQQFSDGFTFLKAVKDRDGEKATSLIVAPGSGAVVINVKESSTGNGALHILTRDRDLTWLTFMLSKGAKANLQNNQGITPLFLAAQLGWIEGADQLLKYGATVDLPNNQGETPLIMAVHNRDVAMVRLLLGRGADPKRTDSAAGYSALDYAKQDNRAAAIVKLLEVPQTPAKAVAGPRL